MLPKDVSSSKLPYHCPPSYWHVVRIYFKFLAFVALKLKRPFIPAIEYRSTIRDTQENMESIHILNHAFACIKDVKFVA